MEIEGRMQQDRPGLNLQQIHRRNRRPGSGTHRKSANGHLDEERNKLLGETLRDPDLSLLRKWLTKLDNPDVDQHRANLWKTIGWEVFERQALLLAAARDLRENGVPNPLKLAATDIFVEKAQRILASRGERLYKIGAFTAGLAIVLLFVTALYVYHADVKNLLQVGDSSKAVSTAYLTVLIVKSTTAGAFVVAIAYFLVSLSRALLHEATVLYSRRHSLRFGRLFVYLMSETMTREDLEVVFNWNAEFSTAFKDIQAENITKSPLVRALETPAEIVRAGRELFKPIVEKMAKEAAEKRSGDKVH